MSKGKVSALAIILISVASNSTKPLSKSLFTALPGLSLTLPIISTTYSGLNS